MSLNLGRDLRFRSYDLAAAPQVVDLWNRAMGAAYPLREAVLRQNIDGNPSFRPDDAVTVWDGERLIGFGLLQRYRGDAPPARPLRGRAWLAAVVVAPEEQRRGIGTRIYRWLVARAPDVPATGLRPGGGIHYFFPGAPDDLPAALPFLASLGFTFAGVTYDLRADLTSFRPSPTAEATLTRAGLSTGPCRPDEAAGLLELIAAEFQPDWWYDADWFFRAGGDASDWLLLRRDERILGMARLHHPGAKPIGPPMYWAPLRRPSAGGLGPIGVVASIRGHGVGTALLQRTLSELRRLGVTDAVADWTDLLGFYGPLGFRPWKRYATAGGS